MSEPKEENAGYEFGKSTDEEIVVIMKGVSVEKLSDDKLNPTYVQAVRNPCRAE